MSVRYSAGIATAYGAAVRGGYTGTYAQWCALMADYATVGQAAAQSAADAAESERKAGISETNAAASEGNASGSKTAAAASAKLAESWAKGGTSSRSGEDTNNASYFAGQASTSATAASGSATEAESWAKGGTSSRTGEDTNNSSYYATQAAASATAAESWAVGDTSSRTGEDTNNASYYATQAGSSAAAAAISAAAAAATDIGTVRSDLEAVAGTVDSIFYVPVTLTLNDGYINNNGTIGSQSDTNLEKYSDYIDVAVGDKFSITVTNPLGKAIWLAVGQRSSTNSWVSRSQLISTSDSSTSKTVEYTVPDGVGKVSFTFRTYGSITVAVKKAQMMFYTATQGAALESRVTTLENGGTLVNVVRPHSKVYSTNHRGWHECPENTLTAYRQSAVHGFPQVETDVRFTADDIPVLLHDTTINRTGRNADGTQIDGDVSIGNITYAQALEYDFGIYKGSQYAGEKIPTLAQFLKLCRDIGVIPYIELVGTATDERAAIIADVVKASGIRTDVVFISNYTDWLQKMITYFPANRYGVSPWTYADSYRTAAKALFNNKAEIFMHMSYGQVTSSIIAALDAENIPIEIWVADAATIRSADAYVSGFTSNGAVASKILYEAEIPST